MSVAGLVLVAAHVGAVVIDGYAPVGWLDAVLPFRSGYRIVWTGLGTLALDLMLVAGLTSVAAVRRRLGHRCWRALHLLSWACWPVAVAHGLATGTDTRARWALVVTLACVALLAGVLGARVAGASRRWVAWPTAIAAVAVTVLLTAAGPAHADWASRAGTPRGLGGTGVPGASWRAALLAAIARQPQRPAGSSGLALVGRLDEQLEPNAATERAREVFSSALPGGALVLVLEGPSFETGLDLASSAVTLGPSASPALFRGAVVAVRGSTYSLALSGPGVTGWQLRLEISASDPTSWTGRLNLGP
jgi:hypothetical protein